MLYAKNCEVLTAAPNSVYMAIAGLVIFQMHMLKKNFMLNGLENAFYPLQNIHANRVMS